MFKIMKEKYQTTILFTEKLFRYLKKMTTFVEKQTINSIVRDPLPKNY